jgi:hypothetical protein
MFPVPVSGGIRSTSRLRPACRRYEHRPGQQGRTHPANAGSSAAARCCGCCRRSGRGDGAGFSYPVRSNQHASFRHG